MLLDSVSVWSMVNLQVLLEKSNGENRVGYIYNTHLQAYQGSIKHTFFSFIIWSGKYFLHDSYFTGNIEFN